MSQSQSFNNTTYSIPTQGDTGWAPPLTRYLAALGTYSFSPAGGLRTLTADLNLGATFGLLAAYYKSSGSNIAATGLLRLAHSDTVSWRNNANSADLALSVNSSDQLLFSGNPVLSATLTSGNILIGNVSNVATSVTVSGDVALTNAGVSSVNSVQSGVITNVMVNNAAAIAYSKLSLAGSVVNSDINAAAAIAYSKLNLSASVVNADIATSAAIAYSKLALTGSILNADLAGSISYSKLTLTGSVVNADISGSAAIAYSKLALTGSILNADLAGSIAYSKLTLTGSILNADINASAAIAYTKLNLANSVSLTGDVTGTLGVTHGGTGTGTAFTAGSVLYAGASGVYSQNNSGLFWDNPNTRLGVNTATPGFALEVVGDIQATVIAGTNPARGMISAQYSSDQASAHHSGKKARGTAASPTAVQALDYITSLVPNPYDGFQYLIPGEAVFQVAPGTVVSNGVVPVDFVVQTGTGTPGDGTDRMRVGYDGKVNIGFGNNVTDSFGTFSVKAIASTNAARLSTADASFAALDITSTGGAKAINVAQGNLSFATAGDGIVGTTSATAPTAGNVGEVISATQTATNFPTTDQWGNNVSISLTAGDWDIYVQVNYPGTAVTGNYWGCGFSTTTGNSTAGLTIGDTYLNEALDSKNHSLTVTGNVRIGSTTVYYLKVLASYSVGTPQYSGKIWARRAR